MKIKRKKNQQSVHPDEGSVPVGQSNELASNRPELKIDTPGALKEYAGIVLDATMKKFIQSGKLDAVAHVIHSDSSIEVIEIGDDLLASDAGKELVFAALGAAKREHQAFGLVTVTDSWLLVKTEEQRRRLKEDSEYREAFESIRAKEGLTGAAAAGFGTLFECVTCVAQTRLFAAMVIQRYQRVNGMIEVIGEHDINDSRDNDFGGRLFPLYTDMGGSFQ